MSLETGVAKKTAARPDQSKTATRRTQSAASPISEDVKRRMLRFPAAVRPPIRALIRKQAGAADLVEAFPGLLHALASGQGSRDARSECLELLSIGAPLKSVAAKLGIPMWVRRLPPEAFDGTIEGLPNSDVFARRVASRLPVRAADSRAWLAAVRFASQAGGDDFALWIARQRNPCHISPVPSRLALLAAHAWISQHPLEDSARLLWTRWRPEMALETAICAAKSWFNRIILIVYMPHGVMIDPWLVPGEVDGLSFVALTSAELLIDEARAMNNCADQYAVPIVTNRCRLFSVRTNRERIATLEVASHPKEKMALAITQLKTHSNQPVSLKTWQAAYRWLAAQDRLLETDRLTNLNPPPPDTERWQALFSGYRMARNGAHWLPDSPIGRDFNALEIGLASLARDCAVRSWLFN